LVRLATISIAHEAEIATSAGGCWRSKLEFFAARKLARNGSTEAGATVEKAT
jgi:hypothetical protein